MAFEQLMAEATAKKEEKKKEDKKKEEKKHRHTFGGHKHDEEKASTIS